MCSRIELNDELNSYTRDKITISFPKWLFPIESRA